MKSFVSLALALMLVAPSFSDSAQKAEPTISASITEKGDQYRLTFTNISDRTLDLPDVYVSGSHRGGYWLFLYDPKEKKIQQGGASVHIAPGMEALPRKPVWPGQKVEKEIEKKYLLEYFMYLPKCYFLVVQYRWPDHPEVGFSMPSKALYQCGNEIQGPRVDDP